MRILSLIVMLMIGMTSLISITGATDIQATNRYVVTPGYDQEKVDVASQYSGTIQQGQWIWNSKYLFMGVCQLPVDLNWTSTGVVPPIPSRSRSALPMHHSDPITTGTTDASMVESIS